MEKRDFEFIKDKRNIIYEIKIELNESNPESIDRISFIIDDDKITWKPKIKKEEYINGFLTVRKRKMTVNEIPDELKKIVEFIRKNGKMDILMSYNILTITDDGKKEEYKFIKSIEEIKKWGLNFDPVDKSEDKYADSEIDEINIID